MQESIECHLGLKDKNAIMLFKILFVVDEERFRLLCQKFDSFVPRKKSPLGGTDFATL